MNHKSTRAALALMAAAALTLTACSTPAEGEEASYPTKDITFIVHAGAGGTSDLTARTLANGLKDELGVNVIVENRPGASGSLAVQYVSEQPADGYTIGYAPVEFGLFEGLGFDINRDNYDFLALLHLAPYVVAVPADSPFTTLNELLEHAKTNSITVSNAGAGSLAGIVAEALGKDTGTKITAVPFDGGAPAVAAVVGSQVDAGIALTGEAQQQHKDGQLRILAVLAGERHPMLPEIPTAAELGVSIEYGAWGGVMAPAGLPDDVHAALDAAIKKVAHTDEFLAFVDSVAAVSMYKGPADFTAFVAAEVERFTPILGK